MFLNTLSPAKGSKKKKFRVGRGQGSGNGKTAGKGHKGQTARAGGNIGFSFEGGQTPLQRRLPKFGFVSLKQGLTAEVRLSELAKVKADIVDLQALKDAGLVRKDKRFVAIICSGTVSKAHTIKGIRVTKGARAAIVAAGGQVLE